MSAPGVPTLTDVLNKIMEAVNAIIYQIASAIAENAGLIGTVVVTALLINMLFSRIRPWFGELARFLPF